MTVSGASPSVKICGVCHAADAAYATAAGAAIIGVILAPGRPRTRTLPEAAAIFAAAGTSRRAGVFVDADESEILQAVDRLGLDIVQLHGAEPAGLAASLKSRTSGEVWKAVRVTAPGDIGRAAVRYDAADALLLEGWSPRGVGGVGAAFDWAGVRQERKRLPAALRVVVAGGLTPDNVASMIALLRPDVADVSSGVEGAEGAQRKSAALVTAFIAAVRGAKVTHG
jgi:phosphoribosylanthranilate isomerase